MTIVYRHRHQEIDFSALREDLILDEFHNGRSAAELKKSFANSHISVYAMDEQHCIGTARALSDQVCNCYVVDVWTQSQFRQRGIASKMMQLIINHVPGQHVYLQTDTAQSFYERLGFQKQPEGMFLISGNWLNRDH
jgi:ribosomal protein S18 acetylase RimI-like enzyme